MSPSLETVLALLDQLNSDRVCNCGDLAQDGRLCNFHTTWFALRAQIEALVERPDDGTET